MFDVRAAQRQSHVCWNGTPRAMLTLSSHQHRSRRTFTSPTRVISVIQGRHFWENDKHHHQSFVCLLRLFLPSARGVKRDAPPRPCRLWPSDDDEMMMCIERQWHGWRMARGYLAGHQSLHHLLCLLFCHLVASDIPWHLFVRHS